MKNKINSLENYTVRKHIDETKTINLTFNEASKIHDLLRSELSSLNVNLVKAVTNGDQIESQVLAKKSAQVMIILTKLDAIL